MKDLPRVRPDMMIMPKELPTSISRAIGRAAPVIQWLYVNKKVIALFQLR